MVLRMRDIRHQVMLAIAGAAIVVAVVTTMWHRREAVPPPAIRAVTILPFETPDRRSEALAIGLAATLMAKLSPIVTVRPPGDRDIDAVLDGRLEATESRIRVHAVFRRFPRGDLLFERRLDYPLRDVGKIEESLSEALMEWVRTGRDRRP